MLFVGAGNSCFGKKKVMRFVGLKGHQILAKYSSLAMQKMIDLCVIRIFLVVASQCMTCFGSLPSAFKVEILPKYMTSGFG